ncbi:MAG: phosphotransferase, partial [Myxococcota bacterium]
DRQASSHRTLLQKRAFNDLEIDPVFGTITKRSRHVEKFVDEINYLRLLPPDLAVLFPRVLGFSTDWNAPELTMEYYGYPSLSEVFVFENVDPSTWEGVFTHLFEVITRGFMQHARPLPSSALRYMTVDKTRDRVAMLKSGDAPHEVLCGRQGKRINGDPHANLEELWPAVEAQVRAMAEGAQAGVVHGDLCLSNILYDLRSRIVKLVDPRGSFGSAGLFGDPRYDVAKLYHSVYGLYDFIVNDLFRVETGADEVTLEIRTRPYHREILERFEKVFFPTFDRREILLLTGLLFASMPSLHYDKPRRQLAMSVRALQLLAEATEST